MVVNVGFKSTITLPQFIVVVTYVLYLTRYFTDFASWYVLLSFCGIGLIGFAYVFLQFPDLRKAMLGLLVFDVFCFLGIAINQNYDMVNIFYLFPFQACAALVAIDDDCFDTFKSMQFFVALGLAVGFYNVVRTGEKFSVSRLVTTNSFSIFMILFLSIDLIWREKKGKNINYIPYILFVVCSLLLEGRGGLITSILFFAFVFLIRKNEEGRFCFSSNRIILGGTLAVLLIFFLFQIINGYISQLSTDMARLEIWTEYIGLAKESLKNFIWGANISENTMLMKYLNMHNDFINVHYVYGLIPLIMYICLICIAIKKCISDKWISGLIIIVMLVVRSMTDTTSFAFMYLWFYFYFKIVTNKGFVQELSDPQ